jgi:hypothetical protein
MQRLSGYVGERLVFMIVVVGMVAAVIVPVVGFAAGEDALDAVEVAPGRRKKSAAKEHVHQVHVGCVIGAKAEKVFDEFKHGRMILGRCGHKASGGQ